MENNQLSKFELISLQLLSALPITETNYKEQLELSFIVAAKFLEKFSQLKDSCMQDEFLFEYYKEYLM